jgi:tRNA-Thr(GGU) m(6)t(6)A37 methyltransferase TsaA
MDRSHAFEPIGVARTPFDEKRAAPRQPAAARGVRGTIELFPGRGYEDALADLDGFTHVWVIFVFDRARGWKPKVLPPRSATKKGLFATRAPHRPNPIGLSLVRLVSIEGLVVTVEDVDLLDQTPVLDLKPYVKYSDVAPEAGDGWLGAKDPIAAWIVTFGAEARAALDLLAARGVDLEREVRAALALGPQPHAYRRIRRRGDEGVLALKEWRIDFRVQGRTVEVTRVRSGYRPKDLATRADLALHRAIESLARGPG